MINKIFTVYDVKTEAYLSPFLCLRKVLLFVVLLS